MKLTLVVRTDLGLGRGEIAAHAAVAAALANLDTPDFPAWLRTPHCRPGRDRTVYQNSQLGEYRTQGTNSIHHIAWPRERRGRGEESPTLHGTQWSSARPQEYADRPVLCRFTTPRRLSGPGV